MPGKLIRSIFDLELEIAQKGRNISVEEARQFQCSLISYREEILKFYELNRGIRYPNLHYNFHLAECIQKKTIQLLEVLKKITDPVESTSSTESKVNDQSIENLDSLLQKQKFYIEMIDSLAPPEGELSKEQAEVRYEHVFQAYGKFTSNQSKLMTFVNDSAFEDQVGIFKDIQLKVMSFQESLKKIILPIRPKVLPEFKVSELFNRTDRPNVIVDYLDSLYKKQKSLIEQFEQIESKSESELSMVEAEMVLNHVSYLHNSFIKNQAKIETYVTGNSLDEELEQSRVFFQKVMSVQTKLKGTLAPVVAPSSLTESETVDQIQQTNETNKIVRLKWLLKKQTSLIGDIKSMIDSSGVQSIQVIAESSLPLLLTYKEWFIANQKKIEELVSDYDLYKQQKISSETLDIVAKVEVWYENHIRFNGL